MNEPQERSSSSDNDKNGIPAFEIDDRVVLTIEHELAINLGKLILDTETENTALLALGHQLRNLSDDKS